MAKAAAYRLDDKTLQYIDALSEALETSKTEVVRRGVATLVEIARSQSDAIESIIARLREAYGDDSQLVIAPVRDASGNVANLTVEVDGVSVDDVQATAILSPKGNQARVYLDVRPRGSAKAEKAVLDRHLAAAATHGLVPLPFIGALPWPSQKSVALRVRIGDLAAEAPAEATREPAAV